MKRVFLSIIVLAISLFSHPVFSQTQNKSEKDTALLGLPGDNLDLYAVLDLFQKSKTIEDFEKSLNEQKTGINNLDLNLDKKVDFIKVVTKQKDKDFTFILQVAVTEKETQDVAVILLSKDKNDKVTMQIVGDKDLYGKDYVIEPKPTSTAATANPGYKGNDTVVTSAPATTTTVVVQSAPIVTYVYSPVYVPYYPPYHYGYYPPYFAAFTVVAVSAYHHNNYYHHSGYHGGYGNTTVVVHNSNTYNNYNNNSRNSSTTVNHNNTNGSYNVNKPSTNQSKGNAGTKGPSTTPSTNQSKGAGAANSPSASPSTNQSKGSGAANSPSTSPSTNQSKGSGAANSPSASPSSNTKQSQPSRSSSRSGGGRRR